MRRTVLALVVVGACAPVAPAQEPAAETVPPPPAEGSPRREAGGMGGIGGGSPGYLATWYPARPVAGSNADLSVLRQNLSLGAPVWKDEGSMLLATAGVRYTRTETDFPLPDTGRPFPGELWNVNVGAMYRHDFGDGWSGALFTSVGSASDRPFHSIDELFVSAGGFLTVPARKGRDQWMLAFFYSSVGSLPFPIPGVAYVWNPNDQWRINVGVPFAVQWRPAEHWTFNLSYIPLTNINARATWQATDRWTVYGGYEFLSDAYFLADRTNRKDRFFTLEQRLFAGARWAFSKFLSLDVQAGYAFDRRYGEGRGQNDLERDRLSVAPGGFVGAGLRLGF